MGRGGGQKAAPAHFIDQGGQKARPDSKLKNPGCYPHRPQPQAMHVTHPDEGAIGPLHSGHANNAGRPTRQGRRRPASAKVTCPEGPAGLGVDTNGNETSMAPPVR